MALTGKEAQEWIKNNPGADYKILNDKGETQKYVRGDKGIIGNLVLGLLDPIYNSGRMVAEGINTVGNKKLPSFLTKDETDNAGRFALQNIAGLASYAIPVGAAASTAGNLARAGLAGGLGAFSNQDITKDVDLGQIALGAGTGAGMYGLTSGISKFIKNRSAEKALAKTGEQTADDVQRGFLNKTINKADDITGDGKVSLSEMLGRKGSDKASNAALEKITQNTSLSKAAKTKELQGLISDITSGKYTDDVALTTLDRASKELDVLNKPANKLVQAGRDLQYDALGVKPGLAKKTGTLDFTGDLQSTRNNFEKALNEFNLPRNSEGISKLGGKLSEKQQAILNATKYATTGDDITRSATDQLLKLRPDIPESQARAYVDKYIQNFADSAGLKNGLSTTQSINNQFPLDADALNFIKQDLFPTASKAFRKETTSLGDDLAIALHDTVKSRLYENVKGFKDVNSVFSDLFEQNPNLVASFSSGNQVSQLGKQAILEKIQKGAVKVGGQALEGVGNVADKLKFIAPNNIVKGVNNLNLPVGSPLSRFITNSAIPQAVTEQPIPTEIPAGAVIDNEPSVLGANTDNPLSGLDLSGIDPAQLEALITQYEQEDQARRQREFTSGLLGLGWSPAEVEKMTQLAGFGGEQKDQRSEAKRKYDLASVTAQEALSLLEDPSAGVQTGKIGNALESVREFFGTQSQTNTAYRSALALARTQARNALLGAAMSDKELQSIEKFIPEYDDEPEIAKQKLRSFISIMQQF